MAEIDNVKARIIHFSYELGAIVCHENRSCFFCENEDFCRASASFVREIERLMNKMDGGDPHD